MEGKTVDLRSGPSDPKAEKKRKKKVYKGSLTGLEVKAVVFFK